MFDETMTDATFLSDAEVHAVALPGREAQVLLLAATAPRRGAILFSHGNESAPWHYAALTGAWRAAGFDVWAPWHVDSREHPSTADYPGFATWKARIEDLRAAAALIEGPYVAAGHSFGALVALVAGGVAAEVPEGLAGPLVDRLAACVLALSPPPPIPGLVSVEGYGALAVPALVQTGTRDVFPGDPETPDAWRVHLPAYEASAPGGNRYLLVLDGADHYFGNAICEPEREAATQDDLLAATVDIAALFLDAFHAGADPAARAALDARLTAKGAVRLATR